MRKSKIGEDFGIKGEDIIRMIPDMGYCFASDLITKGGCNVRYMYREIPDDKYDSGWRFFSGLEDQDFVDNPSNIHIYDVNTIANYDKSIIPYLSSEVGSEFLKDDNNRFVKV